MSHHKEIQPTLRLTDSLPLPELDVRHLLLPALCPEGVEEVEDDALPVPAGEELVGLLDINKAASCQVRTRCLVLITKPLPGCQTFCQAELFLSPAQLSFHLLGNMHLLQTSEEPEHQHCLQSKITNLTTDPG